MRALTARTFHPSSWWDSRLYTRWVGANTLAELAGLGATGALIALLAPRLETVSAIALAGLMVVSGILLEGVVVGALQWWALKDALPGLKARTWLGFTALGAGIAWTLGVVPSTLLNVEAEAGAEWAEPSTALVLGLAALMGLALGPVLATPQWVVLRKHVAKAAWWIPANALAWAFGMVIIFSGTDAMMASALPFTRVVIGLGTLTLTGAVVGAVHGLALVWLVGGKK